jgi:hypothetical protein
MKETVLYINHKIKECGVYQYGLRSGNILKNSTKNIFIYKEIDSISEYETTISEYNPKVVIYNNHNIIMPWLTNQLIKNHPEITHVGVYHEGGINDMYEYLISPDPTFIDTDKIFSSPRPLLFGYEIDYPKIIIPTINSFGFSFGDKGFKKVVDIVCAEFDEAIINLHMPSAHFDRPKSETEKVLRDCEGSVTKKDVTLNINRRFLPEVELLNFLSSSSVNLFPYDPHNNRGISSVIDYALSVDTPIAITKSHMFRHISNSNPSICVEDRKIIDIINSGTECLSEYKKEWSESEFIEKYNKIINIIKK